MERKSLESKREEQSKKNDRTHARFNKILHLLKLSPNLGMPAKDARDLFLRNKYQKPKIEIDSDSAGRPDFAEIITKISAAINGAKFDVTDQQKLSVIDFLCTFVPILKLCEALSSTPNSLKIIPYFANAKRITTEFFETHCNLALKTMQREIDRILVNFTAIDRQLFWSRVAVTCEGRKQVIVITIGCMPPQIEKERLDGNVRSVFRCGAPFDNAIRWVEWEPITFGRPSGPKLPVYVQQHALERLRERIPITFDVEDFLYQSLEKPKIFPNNHTHERLVEYRFYQYLLGYFVARILPHMVVIKTFLFLTMEGTPEHHLLFEKLKLRRPDIEATGLDNLHIFLKTDMQNDLELRELFSECGCGHLFDMGTPAVKANCLRGFAFGLKEYLGIAASYAETMLPTR